eukprot:116469_1
MADASRTFLLAICIFYLLVIVPLLIYHGYKYYLNRTHIVFIKRYAFVTIYEVGFAVIKTALDSLSLFLQWYYNGKISTFDFNIVPDLLMLMANILWGATVLCCGIRFFILSYNLNLTNLLLNSKWQSIINPHDATLNSKMEWYLNKKNTFNNIKWIAKIFSPLFIILVIPSMLSSQLATHYFNYSN